MKTTFDANAIMVELLNNAKVNETFSGEIYVDGSRPLNSKHEDIVVNVVALQADALPQAATSNINIYVPDKVVKIDGKNQPVADIARLKEITDTILDVLRSTTIPGLSITPISQTILEESTLKQHYSNIRINWNIQTD